MINPLKIPIKNPDKIFHVSDIHIRLSDRHEEYMKVFDNLYKVIEKNKTKDSLIVLTGDIFHSKIDLSPESVLLASQLFVNLCELCPLIIIAGNHDAQINNSNRMDSITPIISVINNPNIFYLKDTGLYVVGDLLFNVLSVFDKFEKYILKYSDFVLNSFRKKIVLHHGQLNGAVTENGFLIQDCQLRKEHLDGNDMVLLGDIHKRQLIQQYDKSSGKPAIYYAGSLIQQNFGEDIDNHGVTIWDTNTNSHVFIPIENEYGYVTLEFLNGNFSVNCSKLPKNARLRIVCNNLSKTELEEILSWFRNECNLLDYVVLTKNEDKNNFSGQINCDLSGTNSLTCTLKKISKWDVVSVQKLFDDYCNICHISLTEKEKNMLQEYNKKFFQSIKIQNNFEYSKLTKWEPLKLSWDNMFSYGCGNEIDFSKFSGIVGIFGNNASGKSNIVSSLCYCLYDKWDRGYKNSHIKNNTAEKFNCSFSFKVKDSVYRIEKKGRQLKTNSVKVDLDLYKVYENGNEVKITDVSRLKTDRILNELVGSYEDFLFTTLYIQNSGKNVFDFIDMTNTDRKQFLFNVFKLEIFDQLNEQASSSLKEIKREIDFIIQDQNPSVDLKKTEKELNEKKSLREDFVKSKESLILLIKELKDKRSLVEEKLSYFSSNKVISDEMYNNATAYRPVLLNLIHADENELENINRNISDLRCNLENVSGNIKNINSEEFQSKCKEYDGLLQTYLSKKSEREKISYVIEQKKKKMEMLSKYEYNPNCEFCLKNPFVLDAKKTSHELEEDLKTINELDLQILELTESIKKMDYVKNIRESVENAFNIIKEYNERISSYDAKRNNLLNNINLNKNKLKNIEEIIFEYTQNKNLFSEKEKLHNSLKEYNSQLSLREKDLLILSEKIGQLDVRIENDIERIKRLNEKIEKLKVLEEQRDVLEKYVKITGVNGIAYFILKNFINILENNINLVLSQFEKFTIKIEVDDKSIHPLIKYGDDMTWPIEMASGFERFIISISCKIAFSMLMKDGIPSFLIIDEGFGCLDSSNFLKLKGFFEFLKKNYKFIIVISHMDKVKDLVDKRIDVIKDNFVSKIVA